MVIEGTSICLMMGEPAELIKKVRNNSVHRILLPPYEEGCSHGISEYEINRVLSLETPKKSGTVLDLEMGIGTVGEALIKKGFKYIGIEPDPAKFKIAQSRINTTLKEIS